MGHGNACVGNRQRGARIVRGPGHGNAYMPCNALLQGKLEERNSQPFPPVVLAWTAAPNSDLNVKLHRHVPFPTMSCCCCCQVLFCNGNATSNSNSGIATGDIITKNLYTSCEVYKRFLHL